MPTSSSASSPESDRALAAGNGSPSPLRPPAPEVPTEPAGTPSETGAGDKAGGGDNVEKYFPIAFWIVVFAIGALFWLRSDTADVMVDVGVKDPVLSARGVVLYKGAPVKDGTVRVLVEQAKSRRYVASMTVPVDADGKATFKADLAVPPATRGVDRQLRISADFAGQTTSDGKTKPLSGATTVFVNFSPPLAGKTVWIVGITILVMLAGLMYFFTSRLTRGKARLLFGITYFMTFVSLALPIGVTLLLSQSAYLVEMMEAAPIGLVKGTSEKVQTPQWLLNIGGAVQPALSKGTFVSPTEEAGPLASPAPPHPLDAASAAQGQDRPVAAAGGGNGAGTTPSGDATPDDKPPSVDGLVKVFGGLAVPFYVIFLAMLGAGINMTIQVPKIQSQDILQLPVNETGAVRSLVAAPVKMFSSAPSLTKEQFEVQARVRTELISQYMYLLSAPFLAIAMYYLLQVVAQNTAEPVLVVMSFATGIVSDKIVRGIVTVAENTLPGAKGAQADAAAATAAASGPAARATAERPASSAEPSSGSIPERAPGTGPLKVPVGGPPSTLPDVAAPTPATSSVEPTAGAH